MDLNKILPNSTRLVLRSLTVNGYYIYTYNLSVLQAREIIAGVPYLRSTKPPVSHVITDGFGSRHGTGQLTGSNDGSTTLLNSLEREENICLANSSSIKLTTLIGLQVKAALN